MSEVGKLTIYACGGAGSQVATPFMDIGQQPKGFAAIQTFFIDTSRTNLKPGTPDDQVYIVKGASDRDGSGMIRGENYEPIRAAVKDMLLKFKPTDLNVVVFSGAGGTGSISGPLIVRELLMREASVIAVMIGSDESAKAASNCIDTLESLEGVARGTGRPVTVFYRHNKRGRSKTETDSDIHLTISALAILGSRQLAAVDLSDIYNFINYDRVTTVKPGLACLEICTTEQVAALKNSRPVTMISVYPDKASPQVDIVPDYLKQGYGDININGEKEIHYLIDVDAPAQWYNGLKQTIATLDEAREARPQQRLQTSGKTDDFGMKV